MTNPDQEEIVSIAKALCRAKYQDPDRIIQSSIAIVSGGGSVTFESEDEGAKVIASTPYNYRAEQFSHPRWHEYRVEARNLFAAGVRTVCHT